MASHLMIRFRIYATLATLTLFLLAGCAGLQRSHQPAAANDPAVVAVYNGEVMKIEDFERHYARAVGATAAAADDSLSAYQDFLERYVNFRLKVAAADDAGISSQPAVLEEIDSYRTSLAKPYLLEQEVIEPVVRELYERQQEVVDASHILLRLDPDASPADTLVAFERLTAIRDSIVNGADFGEMALRHSEDPSAAGQVGRPGHRGRLGYFSGGRMVEPFETYAYSTEEGDVSPVFRTQFGYHILYVHDRRSAVPDRRLSHLMIVPGRGGADSAAVRDTLLVLKQRLNAGEDFAALARDYSVDGSSNQRGGDIGYMSFEAPVDASFKTPAFALKDVGDVSDVVVTPYGMHLIKLTDIREPKTYEAAYEDLKKLASRLPRTRAAEGALAKDIIEKHAASVDSSFVEHALSDVPSDSLLPRLTELRLPEGTLDHVLLAIGDSIYTLSDLAEYARTGERSARDSRAAIDALFSDFLVDRAIAYEASRLEDRDPEFRRIMDEFRDGIVLFRFMEDSVWTAAEQDSLGLRAHFEAHAEEYWFPERTRIVSVEAPSDSLLQSIKSRVTAGESIADLQQHFAADTLSRVVFDTTLVTGETRSIFDRALALSEGEWTEPIRYRNGHVILLHDGLEAPRRKTFEEARAQVVSEYQTVLEETLLQMLHDRYNVHLFPDRLERAFLDVRPAEGVETADAGDHTTAGSE